MRTPLQCGPLVVLLALAGLVPSACGGASVGGDAASGTADTRASADAVVVVDVSAGLGPDTALPPTRLDGAVDSALATDAGTPVVRTDGGGPADAPLAIDGGPVADGNPASVGTGPRVLNLSTNVKTLRPSTAGGLVITAVVTSSANGAAVVGGVLKDEAGTVSYGAFAVSAGSGAYSLTLTWNAIQAVQPDTTGMGGATRVFRAVFFDAAGASTTVDVPVALACDFDGDAICSGVCQSVSSSPTRCGGCARSCNQLYVAERDVTSSVTCSAGKCAVTFVTMYTAVNGDGWCMEKKLTCTGLVATYGVGGGAGGPGDCATTPSRRLNSADIYKEIVTCSE